MCVCVTSQCFVCYHADTDDKMRVLIRFVFGLHENMIGGTIFSETLNLT